MSDCGGAPRRCGPVPERPTLRRRWIFALGVTALCATVPEGPAAAGPLRWSADLDGHYVAVGPLGAATRVEEAWDGGFGAEISLHRVSEHRRISAIGLGFGGLRFAHRDGGRLWLDAFLASRRLLNLAVGVSVGAVAEVHEVNPPRWGGQAGLWVFAGVIPYVRIGTVETSGVFIDFGLKIALPAVRW